MTHKEQTVRVTLESQALLGPQRESCLQEMNAIQLKIDSAKKKESQLLDQCSSADRRKESKGQVMKVKSDLLTGQRKLNLLLASTPVASASVEGGR